MIYETQFSIGDVVWMHFGDDDPMNRLRGIIIQITINPGNLYYNVEYKLDKEIKSVSLYEFQMELIKQEEP